jgi:hypothetical protein
MYMSQQFPQYGFQPSFPKTNSNVAIYVGIGIGILILIAGIVYFVSTSSSSSASTAPSSDSSPAAAPSSSPSPAAAPSSSPSPAAAPSSDSSSAAAPYTKCADENGDCTFPSNSPVFYYDAAKDFKTGTVRTFVDKTSINCKNGTFGFDPAEGIVKTCAYAPANSNPWKRCANEGEICRVPSDAELSFFAGQEPTSKNITRFAKTGIYPCDRTSFANIDPEYGSPKACSYKLLA